VALAQGNGCAFTLGFGQLAAQIPQQVGSCLADEAHNPDNGDALQPTSGGMLVWRKADNWTAFTDGYQTWINGPNGLVRRLNTERCVFEGGTAPCGAPAPAGRTAQQGTVRLTYNSEIATNVTAAAVPQFEMNFPADPSPGIVRFRFAGYPVQGVPDAQIFVFPAAEYGQRYPIGAQRTDVLRRQLTERPALRSGVEPQGMGAPYQPVPLVNAATMFVAKPEYRPFGSGSGFRFVTGFAQQAAPISGDNLLYLYQGLTADGRYLVSAWLPVRLNAVLPAPPSDFNVARIQVHNQTALRVLEGASAGAFAPSLDTLDALLAGLSVE
jgi:hypothetical protein